MVHEVFRAEELAERQLRVTAPITPGSSTDHGSSQVSEMLPAFSYVLWARVFRARDDSPIFFSGPAEAEGGTSVLSRRTGSFGISWRIFSLVKKTLHRYRADFEPQRASSFVKRVGIK
jgi:hypothetical protein